MPSRGSHDNVATLSAGGAPAAQGERSLPRLRTHAALLVATAIAVPPLAACTHEQVYASGQAYQRNQCLHLMEQQERERCLARTDTPYGDYRQEAGARGND
jgi:hypothetical protein